MKKLLILLNVLLLLSIVNAEPRPNVAAIGTYDLGNVICNTKVEQLFMFQAFDLTRESKKIHIDFSSSNNYIKLHPKQITIKMNNQTHVNFEEKISLKIPCNETGQYVNIYVCAIASNPNSIFQTGACNSFNINITRRVKR